MKYRNWEKSELWNFMHEISKLLFNNLKFFLFHLEINFGILFWRKSEQKISIFLFLFFSNINWRNFQQKVFGNEKQWLFSHFLHCDLYFMHEISGIVPIFHTTPAYKYTKHVLGRSWEGETFNFRPLIKIVDCALFHVPRVPTKSQQSFPVPWVSRFFSPTSSTTGNTKVNWISQKRTNLAVDTSQQDFPL